MPIASSIAYRSLLTPSTRGVAASAGSDATATARPATTVAKGIDLSAGPAQTRATTMAVLAQLLGGSDATVPTQTGPSAGTGTPGVEASTDSHNATASAVQATLSAMVAQIGSGLQDASTSSSAITSAPNTASGATVENGTANALKRVLDAYAQQAAGL